LSERLLAEDLGYGKSPVRQAVQRLQTDGFVDVAPQQGIVVTTLSLAEIIDYFEMRAALERYVVYRLAGELSAPQVAELRAFLEVQKRQLDASPSPEKNLALLNVGFHKMLCDFLGNKQIIRVIEHQHDMLYRVVKGIYKRRPERERQSLSEHTQIAEAIIGGRAESAAELIEAHTEVGKKLLVGG